MRVLLVTGSFPPMKCGVGDYTQKLAESLARQKDIQIGVLTSSACTREYLTDEFETFNVIKEWSFIELLKIIKIIRRWSPDIVHIQYPTQGYGDGLLPFLLPLISFFFKKKVVQTWHEGFSRRNALELLLMSSVPSGLIFVRPRYVENLHRQLCWALWNKKKRYIPNASAIPRMQIDEKAKAAIKKKYLRKQKRLIVFFGFVYPHKGVELLFDIADPLIDQIVIAGEVDKSSNYFLEIEKIASTKAWSDKVTITGFLSAIDIAKLLAVADAVILPFRNGGGEWNTSIHGAVLNGALVITTSLTQNGYDKKRNLYFAKVDDIQEMRLALDDYAGLKRNYHIDIDIDEWTNIANLHHSFYKDLLFS